MVKTFCSMETGSITLFVLVAILFFLIVSFSIFMTSSNQYLSQTTEIDKIKEEYEQSVNHIDQIYNETLSENLLNKQK